MTFKAYLMVTKDRAGSAGEFVRLARAHANLSGVRSAYELRACLEDGGAPRHLYEAARVVWAEYQRTPDSLDA